MYGETRPLLQKAPELLGGGVVNIERLLIPAFTGFCCLIFLLPTVLCIYVSQHRTVAYFSGFWCYWLFLIPAIIFAVHRHHVKNGAPTKWGMICGLLLPAALLLIIADGEVMGATDKSNQLLSSDCTEFGPKVELQKAWEEGYTAFQACVQASIGTGVPVESVMANFRLQDCEEYAGLLTVGNHMKTWKYLRYLEETQSCSGWCYPAQQLFAATPARDSCANVVGTAFSFMVLPHAEQVIFMCAMLLVGVSTGLVLIGPYSRARGLNF